VLRKCFCRIKIEDVLSHVSPYFIISGD